MRGRRRTEGRKDRREREGGAGGGGRGMGEVVGQLSVLDSSSVSPSLSSR